MTDTRKKQIGRGSELPKKTAPLTPVGSVQSDDVEKVLEHVSSPYRWELLEVPETQKKLGVPKKSVHQKSVKSK